MIDSDYGRARLSKFALGIAFGITKGLSIMILAWAGAYWGYGASISDTIATLYPGYAMTIQGGLIGGLWGLVCGFIFGFILAWIYNLVLCWCRGYCSRDKF